MGIPVLLSQGHKEAQDKTQHASAVPELPTYKRLARKTLTIFTNYRRSSAFKHEHHSNPFKAVHNKSSYTL